MNEQIWSRLDPATRHTIHRSVLRLAVVIVLAGVSKEFMSAFWLFALATSVICGIQALARSEKFFAASLNHWDEALVFLFFGHTAYMLAMLAT
jgi:ABC-type microcin C transport system permease subunit YejB